MNIEYWLLNTKEEIDGFELSNEIASPTEMAYAIKRVRELLLSLEEFDAESTSSVQLRKALYGDDE